MKRIASALLCFTTIFSFAGKSHPKRIVTFDESKNTSYKVERYITTNRVEELLYNRPLELDSVAMRLPNKEFNEYKKIRIRQRELLLFAAQLPNQTQLHFDDEILKHLEFRKEFKACMATTAIAISSTLLYFLATL